MIRSVVKKVLLTIFIGILLGTVSLNGIKTSPKLLLRDDYSINDVGIELIPDELAKYVSAIIVDTSEDATKMAGWVYVGENIVYLVDEKYRDYQGVLIHEAAHVYGNATYANLTYEWADIYQSEWANTDLYGSTNNSEAFAETMRLHYLGVTHEGYIDKDVFPKSLEYVHRIVVEGEKIGKIHPDYTPPLQTTFQGSQLFFLYLFSLLTHLAIHLQQGASSSK